MRKSKNLDFITLGCVLVLSVCGIALIITITQLWLHHSKDVEAQTEEVFTIEAVAIPKETVEPVDVEIQIEETDNVHISGEVLIETEPALKAIKRYFGDVYSKEEMVNITVVKDIGDYYAIRVDDTGECFKMKKYGTFDVQRIDDIQ